MAKPIPTHCIDCEVFLDATNISYMGRYRRNRCRECYNAHMRDWHSENPDARRKYNLKSLFGMTKEEYNSRFQLQLGGCAICKQPCKTGHELGVDHNHKTGQIRDLLCKRCNLIIGNCEEDELLLYDIIDYLKRHNLKATA